jgi:ABC-type nickel/cobalt efflux system permease component RcnA
MPHAKPKISSGTALLLILGSSPMVEGIPAFFAAAKYGVGLILIMSAVFAITTTATYVVLCVYSTAGLQRVTLGPLEKYGEVLSGAFITLVGIAFWVWPVL